jgi:hypothetical protein
MNPEEATNICQDKLISEVSNDLKDFHREFLEYKKTNKETLERLITQTTKTNGTVAEINKWRYMITGGLIVSDAIIVPILLYLIYIHIK